MTKKRRPMGYWQNKKNIEREAKTVIKKYKLNRFSSEELKKYGSPSLMKAIFEQYNGIEEFREVLGLQGKLDRTRKWNPKNIETEARRIMNDNNLEQLPNSTVLRQKGYDYFVAAIATKYPGQRYGLLKALGEEVISPREWEKYDFVLEQAKKYIQENQVNILPGYRALVNAGNSKLASAIAKLPGGFRKLRIILGQEKIMDRKEDLQNLDFMINKAYKIMKKFGMKVLPSSTTLCKEGLSGFCYGIRKYHEGMNHFRELLDQEILKHEAGTWDNEDYCLERARHVITGHGMKTLPSFDRLRNLGYSSLASAIGKFSGGYKEFRKRLGYNPNLEFQRKWGDLDIVIAAAKKIIKEYNLEKLPAHRTLIKMGYAGLATGISTLHSFRVVRLALGEIKPKAMRGSLQNWKSFEKRLQSLIDRLEHFPSSTEFREFGESSLCYAIYNNFGGVNAVKTRMGYKTNQESLEQFLQEYIGGEDND
ncbi:hypothetical protein J4456_02205 [Candidatus Pacearchaeota archaeon]|nr:hypothetical protein [Candidatus Pacearchaeota archaeon]